MGSRSDLTVLEVHRAVVLLHGFLHVLGAIPLAWMAWQAGWIGLPVGILLAIGGIAAGVAELYLAAQVGQRLRGLTRGVVGIYAVLACAGLVGLAAGERSLPVMVSLWISYWGVGASLSPLPAVAMGLQALLAFSGLATCMARGRVSLVPGAPAWLLAWLLSHGLRAVVGAAFYLIHDLGALPVLRWLEARGESDSTSSGGPAKGRVSVWVLIGPVLAAVGAVVAWGLLHLVWAHVPPILWPLCYLILVDLVVLPLLPTLAWIVVGIYGRVARRGEAWAFAISPVFILMAVPAVLVLVWVNLHVWLLRAGQALGRWQIGPVHPTKQALAGAVWIHVLAWFLVTALNAQSGLWLIGTEIPGQALYERHRDTEIARLLEKSPVVLANRDKMLPGLYERAIQANDMVAFEDYVLLTGKGPDASRAELRDLSFQTRRRLVGLPWYYSPAEMSIDKVERCVVFAGCLLLGAVTLIRLPGLNALLRFAWLRFVVYLLRLGLPVGLLSACLVGDSPMPDYVALNIGLVIVGLAVLAFACWLGWVISRDVSATRHYAPFMATRLLQKRRIAFFAIGAVTLCVAMVLIVISVMGGFLDLVRERSHGLLGDLIMQNGSLLGFPGYQEFSDRIKTLRDEDGHPIVAEATPVIYTYGVLRIDSSKVTQMIRVMGIRLDEIVNVTRFGEGLSHEPLYPGTTHLSRQQQPYWGRDKEKLPVLPPKYEAARAKGLATLDDPNKLDRFQREPYERYPGPFFYIGHHRSDVAELYHALRSMMAELQLIGEDAAAGQWKGSTVSRGGADTEDVLRQAAESSKNGSSSSTAPAAPEVPTLADRALKQASELEDLLKESVPYLPEWPELEPVKPALEGLIEPLMEISDKLTARDKSVVDAINAVLGKLRGPLDALALVHNRPGYTGPSLYGVIIGRDLIAKREASGEYRRYYPRGSEMTVAVLPLTPSGTFARQKPISLKLRYVDDSRTGVYDIDSICVYVDFEMMQQMMQMGPLKKEGGGTTPPRASQVLIKLTEGQDLLEARRLLWKEWAAHCRGWMDEGLDAMHEVEINTWEEQQAQFIAAVHKEKILVLTLFAVVSAVAIFLVLCIFYMIVTEKTRDIGILKSVGASAGGVAGVFLAYGAAIGVVGGALGIWLGTIFVHNINTVQDWMARIHPGLRIWSAEVYTFDIIPDKVKPEEAAVIFIVAVISSVLGATFPALRAGRTWPVEALRYE